MGVWNGEERREYWEEIEEKEQFREVLVSRMVSTELVYDIKWQSLKNIHISILIFTRKNIHVLMLLKCNLDGLY